MSINEERIKNFNRVCQKYKTEVAYEDLNDSKERYVFVKKLNVMGCIIHKAGSTSFSKTFKYLRKTLDNTKHYEKYKKVIYKEY